MTGNLQNSRSFKNSLTKPDDNSPYMRIHYQCPCPGNTESKDDITIMNEYTVCMKQGECMKHETWRMESKNSKKTKKRSQDRSKSRPDQNPDPDRW